MPDFGHPDVTGMKMKNQPITLQFVMPKHASAGAKQHFQYLRKLISRNETIHLQLSDVHADDHGFVARISFNDASPESPKSSWTMMIWPTKMISVMPQNGSSKIPWPNPYARLSACMPWCLFSPNPSNCRRSAKYATKLFASAPKPPVVPLTRIVHFTSRQNTVSGVRLNWGIKWDGRTAGEGDKIIITGELKDE